MDLIVFIHGLGGSSKKTWGNFPQLIKADPLFSDYRFEYFSYPTSLLKIIPFKVYPKIQELANGLRTYIKNRTDKNDKVVLVAHSMGGLIARKYLVEEIKNKRKINSRKLLLYSTPNQGSQLANLFWLSRIVQVVQMRKKADFVRELNNDWKVLNVEKYIHVKFVLAGQDRIVDSDSAKNYWKSNDIDVVPAKSHKNIVKPLDANDDSYLIFKNFLSQRYKFLLEDYEKPKIYIPRKIVNQEDYNNIYLAYIRDKLQLSLFEAILKFQKVTLLAGAGEGKTKEVENLVWISSTSNLMIYPIKVNLRFYAGGTIKEIFPDGWDNIPDDQLLVVLDGLDEVESFNIKSVVKSIEYFVEQHPNTRILITCRTNFYLTPNDSFSGTINSFEPFFLLQLDWDDVEGFLSKYLKNRRDDFLTKLSNNKLEEIVRIPFYLINLLKYYNSKFTLPDNIISMFNWLIETRLTEDIEHFRTTFDLESNKKEIIAALEKIAITMESLGRNYALDDEIDKILKSGEEKELLNYSGIIIKKENKWEFEHNNFQEFLAAKILAKQNLVTIKNFISFSPEFNRLIPSWTNTLSFLSSMYEKNDLLEWLLSIQPEILVRYEIDRVPLEIRKRMFKQIFQYYKKQEIWIDRDKYDFRDLGKFGADEDSINLLMQEASLDQSRIVRANAILLLGFIPDFPPKLITKVQELLISIATESNVEILITRALGALINLSFNDKKTTEIIINNINYAESAEIRSRLYNLINSGNLVDDYVDIFLDGIKFIRTDYRESSRKMTLVDEGYNLSKGIEEIRSEESMQKLLKYFIQNPKDLNEVSLRNTSSIIAKNVAKHIRGTESPVFKLSLELVVTLAKAHLLEYTKNFLICFKESCTTLEVFKFILEKDYEAGLKNRLLSIIADTECIDYLLSQYLAKELTDDEVRLFRNFLMGQNQDLSKLLDEKLKSETKFEFPQIRDFEEWRKKQRKRDLEMYFNKQLFIDEIQAVFEKENKRELTEKDIREIEMNNWETPIYTNKALNKIETYSKDSPATLEKIIKDYDKVDFDRLFIHEVFTLLEQNADIELEERHQKKITDWCLKNIPETNFKKVLEVGPGRQFTTSYTALYIWFFLRKFDLKYPVAVLLDLLSFDWHGVGIEYLEQRLEFRKMKSRIIENLSSGNENEIAVNNYYIWGKKHRIKELIPFALNSIANQGLDASTRKSALELIQEFGNIEQDLEKMLTKIQDDFKWEIVETLFKKHYNNLEIYLLKELESENDDNKERASNYLIELQNIEGLKHFYEKVKKGMAYFPKWYYNRNSLRALLTTEAIPVLLQLLELTFQKDFKQAEFDPLEREVYEALTSIALQSEEAYSSVKNETEKFVENYRDKYDKVNFVYSFLERLEQRFYINKSQNITINDVVEKLKLIYS